jgi:hypothetical protein
VNILQLRAEIEDLLTDELGVYTLPNGETTPAISVRADGEALPAGTTAEGLEVVIIRDPDLTPILQYSEAGTLKRWIIFLVVWSTYVEVEVAAAKLIYAYAGSRIDTVPVPRGTGPISQTRLVIPSPPPPVEVPAGDGVYVPDVFEVGVFV